MKALEDLSDTQIEEFDEYFDSLNVDNEKYDLVKAIYFYPYGIVDYDNYKDFGNRYYKHYDITTCTKRQVVNCSNCITNLYLPHFAKDIQKTSA